MLLIQLCCVSIKLPSYLYEIVPTQQRSRPNPIYVKSPRCRRELFQNSFLPVTISDWSKFDIRNSDSYSAMSA